MPSTAAKKSPLITICLLGIVGMGLSYLWSSAAKIEGYIGSLPIQGAQTTVQAKIEGADKASSLAVLYPLEVESKQKVERLPQSQAEASHLVDTSFIRASQAAPEGPAVGSVSIPLPKPVALPDYFKLLPQAVQLDGITGNGAVLSGHFYEVGEPIAAFAYPSKKNQQLTVPVLLRVTDNSAVIQEAAADGTRTVTISARSR